MKNWRIGLLAVAAALPLASPAFAEKAAVGKLECDVSSGVGMFVVEKQKMNCKFTSIDSATVEYYTGQIAQYGVAIGKIEKGVLLWGVISATDTVPGPAALAGEYGGAGADVAFVGGLGANVLVGGSEKSFALQPLSVEGEAGFNIAAGVTTVTLEAAPAPKN